jgi:phosphoenolpyruvate-protein kinase (PTS system EI component)
MQNLKKEMDELRGMIEGKDKEEMSKEDLAKAEPVKEEIKKEELSAEEPVKKVTHSPEKEVKKNINLYAQKRKGDTKSVVFQKLFS